MIIVNFQEYLSLENGTIYSNDKNQDSTKDTIYTLGQEFAGAIQNANGIDITQNRDVHNEYQNAIAQDTVNDMSFGKLVVGAHSQGTLLTYSAMQYIKEDLQNVLKDKKDTILKVGFYGSPVNSAYSSILVKDLYTGSDVNERKLETISNYFRSSINPGDPVGSISFLLGGNGAGINSSSKSEGESSYIWSRGIASIFNGKSPDDLANSSPHSGYVCVIGCGDGVVTPQFGDYVKKDKTTESLNIFYDERNLNKDFANFNQGKINENK